MLYVLIFGVVLFRRKIVRDRGFYCCTMPRVYTPTSIWACW